MYLPYAPGWLRGLVKGVHWQVPTKERVLYLTFDDGPKPETTPWLMNYLAAERVPATHFLLGKNILRAPELTQELYASGQAVGNHGHNHVDGWRVQPEAYLADVQQAAEAFISTFGAKPKLFRPAYGKLPRKLISSLAQQYEIIMWQVVPYDFAPLLSDDDVIFQAKVNAQPGAIVVLHDSIKCFPRLQRILPRLLEHWREAGYRFELLPWPSFSSAPPFST